MNDLHARRWRPEDVESEEEEEEVTPHRHQHKHNHADGEPGLGHHCAPQPPPPPPPSQYRPPIVMTGFVRGKVRYADEYDEEGDDQDRQLSSVTTPTATDGDECPSTLYAALTALPAEEPEVMIVEDDAVEILPTRKRRRGRPQRGSTALPSAPAATAVRAPVEGLMLLDSDNDSDDKARQSPVAAQANSPPSNSSAASNAHAQVILLLDDEDDDNPALALSLPLAFDCVICQERITSTDRATHERSTLHSFNAQKVVSTRKIMLPESNRGVQLLTRLGWKEDKGLGKHGQGQVQPAKSTLKLDRTGLGHTQQLPARVTHFPSHDTEQAARAVDGKSEAQRKVEMMDRRAKKGRAATRGGGGSVTFGEVGRCETARERERRLRKEKETRARITAELNWEEG